MNIIYTVLAAFPIGFLVKQRGSAILAYLSSGAIVFSFQCVSVVLDWLSHNGSVAFGRSPDRFPITYSQSQFWGYGLLNLVVFIVGVGLTILGNHIARRRAARRNVVSAT